MFDLLIEAQGEVGGLFRLISVWDMENIMRYPFTMSGIDGAQSPAIRNKDDHPRNWATFPRLIGTFCRDKCFFTLEACIHRITGLTAAALGFHEKGLVRPGMDADLTVFDFDQIAGDAGYGSADIRNRGIRYVFVNGVKAVENDAITGLKGGRALLRGGRAYSGL